MRVWSAEEKRFVRARFDTGRLPAGIWFVRSGKGNGLMPVTGDGNRMMLIFVVGMVLSLAIGAVLLVTISPWLGGAVMVLGTVAAAGWFIAIARRHGDPTINAMDLVVRSEP